MPQLSFAKLVGRARKQALANGLVVAAKPKPKPMTAISAKTANPLVLSLVIVAGLKRLGCLKRRLPARVCPDIVVKPKLTAVNTNRAVITDTALVPKTRS